MSNCIKEDKTGLFCHTIPTASTILASGSEIKAFCWNAGYRRKKDVVILSVFCGLVSKQYGKIMFINKILKITTE